MPRRGESTQASRSTPTGDRVPHQPLSSTGSLGSVSVVLFDLDDTLIDSTRGRVVAELRVSEMLTDYLHSLGIAVDKETLLHELLLLDLRMNRRRVYDRSYWWQVLIDNLGVEVTLPRSFAMDVTDEYWSYFGDWALPFPDTVTTLEDLIGRGYLLGIVTDTDGTPGIKGRRISLLSFKRAFTVVVIAGEDTPETKPSAAPFKLAASSLGVACSECLFVGDKPFTDIKGAVRAGMKPVLIKRGSGSEVRHKFVVNSLSELCRLL